MTPMIQQYFELKETVPESFLFFRMGDFYEIFGDDAEKVSKELELVLTSRSGGKKEGDIPFCGVPHHSADGYMHKLVNRGYRVAIAEQMGDPAEAKGLVERRIVRVLTPGTLDSLEALEKQATNFILALYENPETKQWIALVADLSTGDSFFETSEDLASFFLRLVQTYKPKEIVCRRFFRQPLTALLKKAGSAHTDVTFSDLSEKELRHEDLAAQKLEHFFGQDAQNNLALCQVEQGSMFLASFLAYLESLHLDLAYLKFPVNAHQKDQTLELDGVALADLEIFEGKSIRELSLFHQMNVCKTKGGARLLHRWFASPTQDSSLIQTRLEQTTIFKRLDQGFFEKVQSHLKKFYDAERLLVRAKRCALQPLEIQKLLCSIQRLFELDKILRSVSELDVYAETFRQAEPYLKRYGDIFAAKIEGFGAGYGIFRKGYHTQLDDLVGLMRHAKESLAAFEQEQRSQTGINNLKIKFHKTYGYLIEVTKSQLSKVPAHFRRRQTMVNNERFSTPELDVLSSKILHAEEEYLALEKELYQEVLQWLEGDAGNLAELFKGLFVFDIHLTQAHLAQQKQYVAPSISPESRIHLRGSRHPTVENVLGAAHFEPNDICLDPSQPVVFLTGPNMAGKSTVMRQVALSAYLHQVGLYIPATAAELPLFDRIFTRIGASDDLAQGESTFFKEMRETATILRAATKHSLLIVDEIGRGTATVDGSSLARAILETLAEKIAAYCLFATHYHELIPIAESLEAVLPMQIQVLHAEDTGEPIFTHKLVPGSATSSYGFEIAELAGVPSAIVARAKQYASTASVPPPPESAKSLSPPNKEPFPGSVDRGSPPGSSFQQPMFSFDNKIEGIEREIVEKIRLLKIDKTTPMQALKMLDKFKEDMQKIAQTKLF